MPYPIVDAKRALKAQELKKKGLSNVQIAKLMDTHENQIRRWLRYSAHKLIKLSTGKAS